MEATMSVADIKKHNDFVGNHALKTVSMTEKMVTIKNIERCDRTLKLYWQDGHESSFHFMWLRHNCFCSFCRNSADGIRPFTILDVNHDVTPKDVYIR